MKRLLAVIAGLALALVGTMAVAAWLSTGGGAGSVSATSVLQAYTPSATPNGPGVDLAWDPSTLADGSPVGGYEVLRHDGATVTSVCQSTVPTTCTDPSPVPDEVQYGVVATIGGWHGPESDLVSFQYDGEAPVTSITVSPDPNADGWNNSSGVTVVLDAADASGVDHIVFTVDSDDPVTAPGDNTMFTVSGAGDHVLTWYAVDTAGNTETTHSRTVRIDPSAPVTTMTPTPAPNAAGWNNTDVSLAFSATDVDASGVRSITVNGVTTAGSTAAKVVTAEGSTPISYFATDVADNVEGANSLVVRIDRTAPTASVDPAGGASWTNDNIVAITASDATSGIASTAYSVDGATLQSYAGPVTLTDGSHSFRYVVTDVAGNVRDQTVTIKVDSVKPTSSIASTTANTWTITASDAAPSSSVSIEYWIDNGSHTTVSGTTAVVIVADGAHTIHWFAKDAAGNQEAQHDLSVIVAPSDTTAPTISNVQPGNVSGGWAAIDCTTAAGRPCATVTDDVGVTSVTMTLVKVANDRCWDGAGGTTNFGTGCPDIAMSLSGGVWVPANGLVRVNNNGVASFNDGQYTLTIKASDAAGNTTTVTRTFTVAGG